METNMKLTLRGKIRAMANATRIRADWELTKAANSLSEAEKAEMASKRAAVLAKNFASKQVRMANAWDALIHNLNLDYVYDGVVNNHMPWLHNSNRPIEFEVLEGVREYLDGIEDKMRQRQGISDLMSGVMDIDLQADQFRWEEQLRGLNLTMLDAEDDAEVLGVEQQVETMLAAVETDNKAFHKMAFSLLQRAGRLDLRGQNARERLEQFDRDMALTEEEVAPMQGTRDGLDRAIMLLDWLAVNARGMDVAKLVKANVLVNKRSAKGYTGEDYIPFAVKIGCKLIIEREIARQTKGAEHARAMRSYEKAKELWFAHDLNIVLQDMRETSFNDAFDSDAAYFGKAGLSENGIIRLIDLKNRISDDEDVVEGFLLFQDMEEKGLPEGTENTTVMHCVVALSRCEGVMRRAANLLCMPYSTFRGRIRKAKALLIERFATQEISETEYDVAMAALTARK